MKGLCKVSITAHWAGVGWNTALRGGGCSSWVILLEWVLVALMVGNNAGVTLVAVYTVAPCFWLVRVLFLLIVREQSY